MRRIITKLDQTLHAMLWLLAFTLIPLAVVVGLGREFFPLVSDQKAWLEQTLSEQAGVYLRIGDLEGSWPVMSPVLTATDIELFHPDDPTHVLLTIPKVSVQPNWLASLRSFSPRLAIAVEGLSLTLMQDASGKVSVKEFAHLKRSDSENVENNLRWLLKQPIIGLTNSQLFWELEAQLPQRISNIKIQQQSLPNDYRMMAEFRIGDSVTQQRLIFQVDGDPLVWRNQYWQAYLDIAELSDWQVWQVLLPEPWRAQQLSGAAMVWLNAERGQLPDVSVILAKASAVFEVPEYGRFALSDVSGVLKGQREASLWSIQADKLSGLINEQAMPLRRVVLRQQTDGLELALAQMRLENLVALVMPYSVLPKDIVNELKTLQPKGMVPRLRLFLKKDEESNWQWRQVSAEFKALALNKTTKTPAVQGLAGWFDATPEKGIGYLDTARAEVDLHTVFREPIAINALSGGLRWFQEANGWYIDSGVLHVANAHAKGHAQFSVRLSTDPALPSRIDLLARLNNAQINQGYRYVPWPQAGDGTLAWLQGALKAGEVTNGDFIYSGEIGPYAKLPGQFEMSLPVRSASLDYVSGWPAVNGLNGNVSIRGRALTVTGTSANIMSAKASELRAEIPDLAKSVLQINTQLDMNLTDLQRLLADSPLAKTTAGLAKIISLEGPSKASLALTIPLASPNPQVQVDATLQGATVGLPKQRLQYSNVSGVVSFNSETGLSASGLVGQLFGQETTLTLVGSSRRGQWTHQQINIRGSADVLTLSNWLKLPLNAHLAGSSSYVADISIPLGGGASEIDVRSDLRGIASKAPEPLTKARQAVLPLRYQSRLGGSTDVARLSVGDIAQARLRWRDDELRSVMVAVGRAAPREVAEGFVLLVDTNRLNVNTWYDYIQSQEASANRGLPFNKMQISANEVLVGQQWVDDLNVEVEHAKDKGWQLRLQGAKLRSLPALPTLNGAAMISREGNNWQADPISVRVGSTGFVGNMFWRDRGAVTTRLQGQLQGGDIGKVLAQFGVPAFIESDAAKADISVQWPGHPEDWALNRIKGKFTAELSKGRLKEAGGINLLTRGFGLLNAGNLMRRLKLDFTDVTKKGLNYDRISLQGELNSGVANPASFVLEGPTVNVRGKGWVDLNRQTLEQDLRVDVPVSSAVPLVAGFLAGPVVGGALVAADFLLDKQLSKVTSLRYRVSGPWSDLKLDDERLEGPLAEGVLDAVSP
ncbi:MAG: DUF3971 domain-containing protein [Moraxellaceae bacterium]|nr:DUF3971 domain-containing protein [Moraxellaceae bacterium]MDZ4388021.1 DUF3971 domain-containing protein [Moraxellaceae bacterium]